MKDFWLVYWPDGTLCGDSCFSARQAYWQGIYFSRSKHGVIVSVFMMTVGFDSPFLDRQYQYGKIYEHRETVVNLSALGVSESMTQVAA